MKIPKQGYTKRKTQARGFWVQVATDYKAGLTPTEIAKRYKNPKTGKHYTREHICWILKTLRKTDVRDLEKMLE